MISTEQIQDMLGRGGGTLVGTSGDKLGKVGQVFLDDETGKPEWVTVSGGMFGGESFVPLTEATLSDSEITRAVRQGQGQGRPKVSSADGHISPDEEAELYRYYGMNYSTSRSDSGLPAGDRKGQVGHDTSGPTTTDAMTRSEERLKGGHREGLRRQGAAAQVRRQRTSRPLFRSATRRPASCASRSATRTVVRRWPVVTSPARSTEVTPDRGASRGGEGGRPGRTGADGDRDGHRPAAGHRGGPQGADRV